MLKNKFNKIHQSFVEADKVYSTILEDKLIKLVDDNTVLLKKLAVNTVSLKDIKREFTSQIIDFLLAKLVNKKIHLLEDIYIYPRGLGKLNRFNTRISFCNDPVSVLNYLFVNWNIVCLDELSDYQMSVIKRLAKFCFKFNKLINFHNNFHFVVEGFRGSNFVYLDRTESVLSYSNVNFDTLADVGSVISSYLCGSSLLSLSCFIFDKTLVDRVIVAQKDFVRRVDDFFRSVKVAFEKELLFKFI